MIDGDGGEARPAEVVGVPRRGPEMLPPVPFQAAVVPEVVRPRRAGRVVAGVLVAGAVVAGMFLTASPPAARTAAVGASATATANPAAGTGPSPSPSASRPPTAREIIEGALAAQDRALLAGDLDGYLAAVDPSLREWYRMRYASLRALGVGAWASRVAGAPVAEEGGRLGVLVESALCFGTSGCRARQVFAETSWSVAGGRPVMTAAQRGTEPWDVVALQAVTGRRVVVAAPAKYAGKLASTLTTADRSAGVADTFAHWGAPPDRYVVYLGGAAEWRTWFGGERDDEADAYAHGDQVVARADRSVLGLRNLLIHEFTHVVSLRPEAGSQVDWWLVEGLAEYAADRDGSWTKDRLPFVRRYVRQGRWDGTVALGPMPEGLSGDDWIARYGVALLAVTRLAQRYGEPAMLAFFAAVVHDGTDPVQAAPATLGTDWPAVAADCATYIRSRVT